MNYTTQMDAAKKGIVTKEMKDILSAEPVLEDFLLKKISEGKIAVPANKNHKSLQGRGIGEGLRTKVNVNIGVSSDCMCVEDEMDKARLAIEMKADAIMDLSTTGLAARFRKKLINMSSVMIGSVPVYNILERGRDLKNITVDDYFSTVEEHVSLGIDFITVHAGLTRTAVERLDKNKRLTSIVSRGGALMYHWMRETDKENPFYEHFGRLLELCKKHDVTLSLGDGLRPGSLHDSTDAPQIQELLILGELVKEAWKENVQVMIEGPGHIPVNEIVSNIQLEKKLCYGAPFYVLGPVVTDIAPGYDHITSAIGGAIAASAGADFLCYVTPAEHLRLPTLEDMKEGIIASRIAAHASDIAKGINGAREWDDKMSNARGSLDWKEMQKLSIDPIKFKTYRESVKVKDDGVCSMCGDLCPVKRMKNLIN